MIERRIVVGAGEVVLLEAGGGAAGLPIVWLHGSGSNHRFFAPLLESLPEHRGWAPSLPGRCGSAGPPLQTIAQMSAWLVELLTALGPERVILGGHSMGGAVVMQAMLDHASQLAPRIAGLVLVGTGASLAVPPALVRGMRQKVRAGDIPDAGWFMYHASTPRAVIAAAEAERSRTPMETTLTDWYAANAFAVADRVAAIQAPTLLIAAADDPMTPPSYSEALAARLPKAELVVLADAGHLFPLERAGEVARHVGEFGRRLGKEAENRRPPLPERKGDEADEIG